MVVTERRGPVFLIGLDRPEARNALDEAMVDALHGAFNDAASEPCVVIVHSLVEKVFVSGADIRELLRRDADDALRSINVRLFDRIEAHRWPTVAAIDGWALGGGCELMLACDFRIATNASTRRGGWQLAARAAGPSRLGAEDVPGR